MLRRFRLVRHDDPSGVSGTGEVADGVVWPDGHVAMQWRNSPDPTPELKVSTDALLVIHGHGGSTVIEWDDASLDDCVCLPPPNTDGPQPDCPYHGNPEVFDCGMATSRREIAEAIRAAGFDPSVVSGGAL